MEFNTQSFTGNEDDLIIHLDCKEILYDSFILKYNKNTISVIPGLDPGSPVRKTQKVLGSFRDISKRETPDPRMQRCSSLSGDDITLFFDDLQRKEY